MKKFKFLIAALVFSLGMGQAIATITSQDNYIHLVQGINAKFDRDYQSLNADGQPDPGVVATVEMFLTVFNQLGINAPGDYHFFFPVSGPVNSCNQASATCQEVKLLVRNSIHAGDSTLFGQAVGFQWDIVVWSNNGQGFTRFLEGYYSPVAGTAGQANIMLISCSGCSTVGHSQIEWDGTGSQYHLRAKMFDSLVEINPLAFAGIVIDAKYSPSTGDMLLAVAANNVCDSTATGNEICSPNGADDHTTGYSAILHANSTSGNVFIEVVQGANNSSVKPTTASMCIKSDKTADLTNAACVSDGIDNFNGLSAYAPVDAPISWIAAGQPWLLPEITDQPVF